MLLTTKYNTDWSLERIDGIPHEMCVYCKLYVITNKDKFQEKHTRVLNKLPSKIIKYEIYQDILQK